MRRPSELKIIAAFSLLFLGVSIVRADSQKTFASPEEAVQAVIRAAEKDDAKTLLSIFGTEGQDIVQSGDLTDDHDGRLKFSRAAHEKMALIPDPMNPDRQTISVGEQDWPFPIPLVRKDGRWSFDSAQGREEILARRVGSNEMNAMEVCRGYVAAQYEYAHTHVVKGVPVYAPQIVSSPGKQDGLYWDPAPGAPGCLIPKGFAKAAAAITNENPDAYHGYFFKVLKEQGKEARGGAVNYVVGDQMIGGFGLVAWPAKYGVSGIQTFIVNHDGIVYEKSLGPETQKIVQEIAEFNPDPSWHPVRPE